MEKITFNELVNNISNIIKNHPLVEHLYINQIPDKDIIYSNVYLLFKGIDLYERFAMARFRFVWNDLLNVEKDNETEHISTGISVLKQIFDKIQENKSYRLSNNGYISNLSFAYQTNADVNVSVYGEISIVFEMANNCTYY